MASERKEENGELAWKDGDKERRSGRERAMIKGIIPFYYTMELEPRMPAGQEGCRIH